jgi:hypothetical protein
MACSYRIRCSLKFVVAASALLGACNHAPGGNADQSAATDLSAAAASDLTTATVDQGSVIVDLAVADLAITDFGNYSGVGGPCGGFTTHPFQCLPGLVCKPNHIPDIPGTCVNPDMGSCQANGSACSANAECCSGNCILRTMPGFCCQPLGCP